MKAAVFAGFALLIGLSGWPFGESGWVPGPPLPEPRWLLGAAADANGRIAILGGYVIAPPHAHFKKPARQYGLGQWAIRVLDVSSGIWREGPIGPKYQMKHIVVIRSPGVDDGPRREHIIEKDLWYEGPQVAGDGRNAAHWFTHVGSVVYDFELEAWRQPEGPAYHGNGEYRGPTPSQMRYESALAAGDDGRIYLLGGRGHPLRPTSADKMFQMTSSVDVYVPGEDRWEIAAALSQPRSSHAAALGPNGKIYVFGGCACDKEGSPSIARTEAYDPKTNSWSTRAPMPEARQMLTATTGPDGRIYVIGGLADVRTSDSSNRVDIYDPGTDKWTDGPPLQVPRHGHAAARASNGHIYVLGGWNAGGKGPNTGALDSVEILDTTLLSE